jgi:hypothetical protein
MVLVIMRNIERYADMRGKIKIFSYNALALKKAWNYPTNSNQC